MLPILYLALLSIVHGFEDFRSRLNLTGLDQDAWWGATETGQADTRIKRVKVEFRDEMIEDLKYRLHHRRPIIPTLQGAWFEYGMNSGIVEDWLQYWEKEYPFKQRQDKMNQFPHYVTNVQGLDIHFVRVRPQKVPKGVEVVPLIIMDGWPSSFVGFYEVIPRLTALSKHRDFAVEVIYPSIPGFTLSEASVKPGLGPAEVGILYRKLMHRLGHKKYYIASNDMGMFIANFIVTAFPEDVLGYFTQLLILQNSLLSSVTDSAYTDSVYTANYTGRRTRDDDNRQSPYLFHQASSPDTLGIGLNDSPSGLLGYILEKFHFARVLDRKENAGVKIQDHIPRDVLLDNIMLYWMTGSITTSMRFYAETFNDRVIAMNVDETPSPVLTWITEPRYEISPHPHWVKKTKFPNLVSHKILNFGGHFLYYEFPDVYANEVISAVAAFRKIHISKNGL